MAPTEQTRPSRGAWGELLLCVGGVVLLSQGAGLLALGRVTFWLTWLWLGLGLVLAGTGLRWRWVRDQEWNRGRQPTLLTGAALLITAALGAVLMWTARRSMS